MPTTEQVMKLLKTRCSIHAFRDKPLSKETIERIIDGARFAPSGQNSQEEHILVTNDACNTLRQFETGLGLGHFPSDLEDGQ